MTATLEQIYMTAPESEAYAKARFAKAVQLTSYLAVHLDSSNYEFYQSLAFEAIDRAEEMGRIHGDEISGEIAGRYTPTGNPLPFTI